MDLYEMLVSGEGLSLEVWMTTASLDQVGPARIVSYSQDPFHRNFTLGQEKSDLIWRLRTTATDENGISAEITVPGLIRTDKLQQIVVSCDYERCQFYSDGRRQVTKRMPGGSFQNWDPTYRLLIGNEQSGDRPWVGSIKSVAIYDRPVSDADVKEMYQWVGGGPPKIGIVAKFDFASIEGRQISDKSGAAPGMQLHLPYVFENQSSAELLSLKSRNALDFIENFLVFLPLGVLLLLNSPYKSESAFLTVAAVVVLAFPFALFTESLQYFVASRTSSVFDFSSGIAGSLAGSALATLGKSFGSSL
jgi:hypothetical protein